MSNRGFTLVEVLIAVGVLTVASFAFMPSFTSSLNDKKLQQSIDAVRDATATARNRALTEVGSPGADETQKYKYSGVRFENNSPIYTQFRTVAATKEVCANPAGFPAIAVVDSAKTLPSGIVARIQTTPVNESPTCVFFEFKTAETVTTKGPNDAVMCTDL
jgi:prepilin-type N-terminal cleavage/methylation domain-containing protein